MSFFRSGLCSLLLAVGVALGVGAAHAAEGVDIARDGVLADVTVSDAMPVDEVLQALAQSYGAKVAGSAGAGEVGPLRLAKVTLDEALVQLLPHAAFSMRYPQGGDSPDLIVVRAISGDASAAESDAPPLQPPPLAPNAFVPNGQMPNAAALSAAALAQMSPAQRAAACALRQRQIQPNGQNGGRQVSAERDPCAQPNGFVPPRQ